MDTTNEGPQIPDDLDGLWLLTGSDLSLDIDLATAMVDAKTSCARLLGSLTFEDDGERTSFSLPGRDDSNCSNAEITRLEETLDTIDRIAAAKAEPGGFSLLDSDGVRIGTLASGG